MSERREITPAQFTREMAEGEGAGPGAPETIEPRTGRPGGGGHGPEGAAGGGMATAHDPRATGRTASADTRPGPVTGLATTTHVVRRALLRLVPGGGR